jgi:hypothetical protein
MLMGGLSFSAMADSPTVFRLFPTANHHREAVIRKMLTVHTVNGRDEVGESSTTIRTHISKASMGSKIWFGGLL